LVKKFITVMYTRVLTSSASYS